VEEVAPAPVGPAARVKALVGTESGRRLLRYGAASVVNVVLGEAVLALAFGWLKWSARSASVLAAVLAAGPAYWLARRWVWGRSGRSHLLKEVLPFWLLALVGLALTTWAAGVGETVGVDAGASRLGQTAIVMTAVLGASAAFWVIRFVLLNRVLFADRAPARSGRGLPATRR
jgi:putative flippase GtrA